MSATPFVEEIRLVSPDGAENVLRCFGGGDAIRDVVLVLPAMGTPSRAYERLAAALVRPGRLAALLDLRGFGSSSERAAAGHDFGYTEIIRLDIPHALHVLRARFAPACLFVLGHSLGGQLATLAVAADVAALDGLVLVAAGTAHRRHWRAFPGFIYRALVLAIDLCTRLFPFYPGSWIGFGGDQPRRFMRDWLDNARRGRYPLADEGIVDERGPRPKAPPVLDVAIEGDVVAPPGARADLVGRLPAAHVDRVLLAPRRGEGRWRRHFGWLCDPGPAATAVAAWIDKYSNGRFLADCCGQQVPVPTRPLPLRTKPIARPGDPSSAHPWLHAEG